MSINVGATPSLEIRYEAGDHPGDQPNYENDSTKLLCSVHDNPNENTTTRHAKDTKWLAYDTVYDGLGKSNYVKCYKGVKTKFPF